MNIGQRDYYKRNPPLCSQLSEISFNAICMDTYVFQRMHRSFLSLNCLCWSAHCSVLREEYLPLCAICDPMWILFNTIKNPIFGSPLCQRSLTGSLSQQPQSAADQILSVRREKNMPCAAWFRLALLSWATWKSRGRVRCAARSVEIYA